MIRITAACHLATPAACWEPNSLRGLRSVTHAPPRILHPTAARLPHCRLIGRMLSANDRCLAPPSFSFSSVTLLSCSRTPSSLRHFFKHLTASPRAPTRQIRTHRLPPLSFCHLKTKQWRDVSFTTKVETQPHRHLLLFRHGVNTNEEEMSPLLCPHLSQRLRDALSSLLLFLTVTLSAALLVFC